MTENSILTQLQMSADNSILAQLQMSADIRLYSCQLCWLTPHTCTSYALTNLVTTFLTTNLTDSNNDYSYVAFSITLHLSLLIGVID